MEATPRFSYINARESSYILQILAIPPVNLTACLRITFEADILIDDASLPAVLLLFCWLIAWDAFRPPTMATSPGVRVGHQVLELVPNPLHYLGLVAHDPVHLLLHVPKPSSQLSLHALFHKEY